MKRKSQMEIMGLAIIIILISLAMLFVVSILLKPSSDIKKTFTHKELASNTVNTLLPTTTGCKGGLSVSDLLIDCAESGVICCSSNAQGDCIKDSCDYAYDVIDGILKDTLDAWNKDYELTIPRLNNMKFGVSCSGEKITSAPCCILPTDFGPMKINLDICG